MDLLATIIKFIALVAFAALTLLGGLCQAFDGLSEWVSKQAVVLKPKSNSRRLVIGSVLLILGIGAVLLACDMWQALRSDPARRDAMILVKQLREFANRAEKDAAAELGRLGISYHNEYHSRFDERLRAVRDTLDSRGKHSSTMDEAARRVSNEMLNESKTNVVRRIRETANEVERLAKDL